MINVEITIRGYKIDIDAPEGVNVNLWLNEGKEVKNLGEGTITIQHTGGVAIPRPPEN